MIENVLFCCSSPFYVHSWAGHCNLHILPSTVCLASWRAVLEKVTVSQLVKTFPDFCGTQRFISVFARACHLSLSWTRSIWSTAFHHFSWILIFLLFSHLYLGLENSLFPSGFPTNTLYVFLFSFISPTCCALLILCHLYKSCHSSLLPLLQLHLTSSHIAANAAEQHAVHLTSSHIAANAAEQHVALTLTVLLSQSQSQSQFYSHTQQ